MLLYNFFPHVNTPWCVKMWISHRQRSCYMPPVSFRTVWAVQLSGPRTNRTQHFLLSDSCITVTVQLAVRGVSHGKNWGEDARLTTCSLIFEERCDGIRVSSGVVFLSLSLSLILSDLKDSHTADRPTARYWQTRNLCFYGRTEAPFGKTAPCSQFLLGSRPAKYGREEG